jgi:hypothetical protein
VLCYTIFAEIDTAKMRRVKLESRSQNPEASKTATTVSGYWLRTVFLHLIYLSIPISLNIRKNQEYQAQKRYSPAPDLPDYPDYQNKSE